ncbi:MAG: LamG-like jellyroll fold domain-containing protein, partial [Ignavibacteria bacterium]|nr:LamG-like jellyroll fold domain-containing protein [Ignavibacteria bacterium]
GSDNFVSNYFNGLIDEVRIYNRALTPAEITAAYNGYKVITSFVPPPSISNFGNVFTPCVQSRIPTFSWQTNATMPYDYQIRLCSNSGCTGGSDPLVLEEKLNTSSTSWAPACTYACDISPYNNINFGGSTYSGQVRVRNISGGWSGWTSSAFTTYNHAYPFIDFTWLPASPNVNEEVQFTDGSTVYGGATKQFWLWTFPDGNPSSATTQNATTIFTSAGSKQVTLKVTDSSNYWCQTSKSVSTQLPLPEYKEVPPLIWLKNFFAAIVEFFNGFLKPANG